MSRGKTGRLPILPPARRPLGRRSGLDPHPTVESTASAAARLGLSVRSIRRLIAKGTLEARKQVWRVKAVRLGIWLPRHRLHVLSDTVTAYLLEQVRQLQEEHRRQDQARGKTEAPPRGRARITLRKEGEFLRAREGEARPPAGPTPTELDAP